MPAGLKPENYIVKGMNEKYNYFAGLHFIVDLEYNVPIQAIANNSLAENGISQTLVNQRKVFEDCSRYLSIDHPNALMFAENRMNLLFWSQIQEMGNATKLIRDNTDLDQFTVIYSEFSLFHFFA